MSWVGECGACTACCVALPIDDPAIAKPANERCLHCIDGGGCAIYARRPEVCRDWHCGWRTMPELGEEWRPDRCGVVIKPDGGEGLIFLVTGDPFVVFADAFVETAFALISRGVPVDIALLAPAGFFPGAIGLNALLEDAVARNDRGAARAELARAVEWISAHTPVADGIATHFPV